jgi:hypothetical protein
LKINSKRGRMVLISEKYIGISKVGVEYMYEKMNHIFDNVDLSWV